jgi:hypothetical protein
MTRLLRYAPSSAGDDFYDLFLSHLEALTSNEPLPAGDISKRLNLKKTQVGAWLEQGVREKMIHKLGRPVRYRYASQQTNLEQLDLPVAVPPEQAETPPS